MARGGPPQVVAVADAEEGVLIDAPGTPGLSRALARWPVLGGYRAKTLHQALGRLAGDSPKPKRWACIELTELVLSGGRPWDCSFEGIARRHLLEAPPDPQVGLEALRQRAVVAAAILARQIPALKAEELGWASKIEAGAVVAVAEMERAGMAVNAQRWRALVDACAEERQHLRVEVDKHLAKVTGATLFGEASLNLEADAELKDALHRLGHPVPNVRRATLEALPAPLGPALSRYRELTKIVTAYGDTFLEHIGNDGRVHPTFEQIGASTGRMACHSPNLQAVVKTSAFRDCFAAPPGRSLVVADYATCELRILAQVSGDPVFREAFARGEDLHARVASSLFGVPVSKTENPHLRQRAKAINFGLCYGMGPGGLARQLETDVDTARALLRQYFETFPKIRRYLEGSAQQALRRGYARTLSGRRLYLAPPRDRAERAQSERIAKNMPIQGSNADITKLALGRVHEALSSIPGAFLVNAVHDELVVECETRDAPQVAEVVAAQMKQAAAQLLVDVPIEVDAVVSQAWNK